MKKLRLEALAVESFTTAGVASTIRGTVHARRTLNCDSLMPETCWVSCAETCMDVCSQACDTSPAIC
jgi:hypothetical protein